MAGGGLMQLVAYGAQDVYLTGNPQITFFKAVYKDTLISLLKQSHKLSLVLQTSEDVLLAQSLEMVTLSQECT